MPSETLAKLKKEIDEASALHVALNTGKFRTLKKDLRALFRGNAILRDLYPRSWFRADHASTEALVEAIVKAKTRIAALDASSTSLFGDLSECKRFARELGALASASPTKQTKKDKHALKAQITQFLNVTLVEDHVFERPAADRLTRVTHTPSARLLRILDRAKDAIEKVETPRLRSKLQSDLQSFETLLLERKKMQARRAAALAGAEDLARGSEKSIEAVGEFAELLAERRRGAEANVRAKEAELAELAVRLEATAAALHTARTLVAQLEEVLEDVEPNKELGKRRELDTQRARVRSYEVEEQELLARVDDCDATLSAALRTVDELLQVENHATTKSKELADARAAMTAELAQYERLGAFVHYVDTHENVRDTLKRLGKFVKGDSEEVDALGSMMLRLEFAAGARVGVELGILDLNAKVELTLFLSGELSVLDSREMMFAYRLGVYASASATARASLRSIGEAAGETIKLPTEMVGASARANCALLDKQKCHVYRDDEEWAASWAHSIARRIAFLRNYKATDEERGASGKATDKERGASGGGDWVEAALQRLAVTEEWRDMLGGTSAERGTPRVLSFAAKGTGEVQAGASIGTHSIERGSSRTKATFGVTKKKGEARATLADLVEDSAAFKYEKGFEGRAVLHSYAARHYLEVQAHKEVSAGLGPFKLSQSRSTNLAGETPETRLVLAEALDGIRVRTLKKLPDPVALPGALGEIAPGARSKSDELAVDARARLDWIASHRTKSKVASLVGELPSASAHLHSASSGAARVSSGLASGLSQASSALAPASSLDVATDPSSSAYVRFTSQPRFTLDGARITWEWDWAPQVYRGLTVQKFDFSISGSVAVAPLVAAYFRQRTYFHRVYSVYEVLGLDTFSYLKTLYVSFRGDDTRRWEAYLRAHEKEILAICQRVTNRDSGAFAEVLHDALGNRPSARALANVCWENFSPDDTSPFATRPPRVSVVTGARAPAALLAREVALFADLGPKAAIDKDTKNRQRGWANEEEFQRKRGQVVAHRGVEEARRRRYIALSGVIERREALLAEWGRRRRRTKDEERGWRLSPSAERELLGRLERSSEERQAAVDFLVMASAGEEKVAADEDGALFALTMPDESYATQVAAPLGPEILLQRLLGAVGEAFLLQESLVPGVLHWQKVGWQNISVFQRTSKETKDLTAAVSVHEKTTQDLLRQWADAVHKNGRGVFGVPSSGIDARSVTLLYEAALAAIDARVASLAALLGAVDRWIGDRKADTSHRMVNVLRYLQSPALAESARLGLLRRLMKVRKRWADALEVKRDFHVAPVVPPPRKPVDVAAVERALTAYLKETYGDFEDHALMHGVKKPTIGDPPPVTDLAGAKPLAARTARTPVDAGALLTAIASAPPARSAVSR